MPAVEVLVNDVAPPASIPSDSGTLFASVIAERGRERATLCRSMKDVTDEYGDRISGTTAVDVARQFFRAGGSRLYLSRKVASAAVAASATVGALSFTASSKGAWGSSLTPAIVSAGGGFFYVTVTRNGVIVEQSPQYQTKEELANWATLISKLVSATVTATALAATTGVQLSGGSDGTLANADRDRALGFFIRDFGPGQVVDPGGTTSAAHNAITDACIATDRVGLLSLPDTSDKPTLKALVDAHRIAYTINGERRVAFVGGAYPIVPGLTPGSQMLAYPDVVMAGRIAEADRQFSPNEPAAGENGIVPEGLGVSRSFSDADHRELNDYGINLFRVNRGLTKLMGYRSGAPKATEPLWWQFNHSRAIMFLVHGLSVIGDKFLFRQLDGQGTTIAKFLAQQTGFLQEAWIDGMLYGATPDKGFRIDVGAQVNTPQTLNEGELRSSVTIRLSSMAEEVKITIIKRQLTEEV